jgi:hypothetical protein
VPARDRIEDLLQQTQALILGHRAPGPRQAVARPDVGTSTSGHGPPVRHKQIVDPGKLDIKQTQRRPDLAQTKASSPFCAVATGRDSWVDHFGRGGATLAA